MRSKGLGLVAAVGGALLFAASGTPAHATFWCKGGTHGFGAAKTAAAAPAVAPAARKHAWIGKKRHAWRSGRAYGYAAAPVRGYRYGYGPRYGYRSGVAIGVSVGDRDRRFRFRDRDRRYGFRDRDDRRADVRVRARAGDDGRRAEIRTEAGARAGRRGDRE